MGRINLLEQNVFNMISAGEVVERPASVVKELIENSIDAGATSVDVYIEEGGCRRIQVSDDGIGILKEDMRNAFMPHATSKLKEIIDLDSLSTLGFRGEALASISSVSEVTLISSCAGYCSKISLSGGKVTFEGQDSRAKGTIITVDNLFFNTPARLKFLKKASSEQHYVQDVVRMLILANPTISITLSSEEGVLLSNEGGNLIDAIYSVYGAKVADNLLEIKQNPNSLIKVSGYISKIDYVKPNRTYQTFIVNGRGVEDTTIQTALERAYQEFLMKRSYPMAILDIVMPFEDVDANVHPSKTEVRFRDKNTVFSAIYHAVQDTLNSSIANISYGFDITQNNNTNVINNGILRNLDNSVNESAQKVGEVTQVRLDTSKLFSGKTTPKDFVGNWYDLPKNVDNSLSDSPISAYKTIGYEPKLDNLSTIDTQIIAFDNKTNKCDTDKDISIFDGKIIGQIFSTYIVCERDNLVYLIDQHAAHERILYDEILQSFSVDYKQGLLIPYKMSMTGEEEEYFVKILPNLKKLGFDINNDGGAYLITAVPEPVSKINFSKFFTELFANMYDESELTLEGLLKDKLCQQACKSAIKGGEMLTRAQIERVITSCVDENGNLPTKCPHGRPAVIAFTITEIEKLFKRIV